MAEADDIRAELKTLKADLATLKHDLGDLVGLMKDLGVSKGESVKSAFQEHWHEGSEKLKQKASAAKKRAKEAVDDTEEYIGEHPLASVGVAFGVGFLIAKLLDMRGRH
ncbi:MAG: DUF883 family protein [Gammaproteobacteria bacterium]|nr:DUF883 family protein [Gammaproteobacteria bacterium]